MRCCVVLVVFAVVLVVVGGQMQPLDGPGALQVLKSMGLDRGGGIPQVTQGERLRQGDSPIYYIKLPPMPYFYVNNNLQQESYPTTSFPFHRLDLDFTNNGRPTQIYHWNQATSIPDLWNLPSSTSSTTTTTTTPATTTTTTPQTTTTTITTPTTTTTIRPIKKPWLTLNKFFPYNGRPSNVYIWKPRPSVAVQKYKHPYFKHFNY
ncbi:hypothetical protein OTU49_003079 [Cherax quadricarinatus]|uniref:Uncharacterized protein n=1 Tax=Cherax quadricarinatus TaxID=27406 RepID=A0AAW0XQB0_CHEQU